MNEDSIYIMDCLIQEEALVLVIAASPFRHVSPGAGDATDPLDSSKGLK